MPVGSESRSQRREALACALVAGFVLGCGGSEQANESGRDLTVSRDAVGQRKSVASTGKSPNDVLLPEGGPSEADYPALANLFQVTARIYSGGEPVGETAFASLAKLGIKTVVSVDGTTPDVRTARKYGLHYVHIPIGYDGISEKAGASLTRLMREREGPMYFHCHHGVHRGPAAAAVACAASGATDGAGALAILERGRTSKDYAGLWRDVAQFTPPAPDVALPELVEVADVGSLAAAMAKLDRGFDNLELCRDAQWSVPPKHPDVVPAREALLIKEGLHEAARNLVDAYDDEFRAELVAAEQIAADLEAALRGGALNEAETAFTELENSCKACHKAYRN